MKLASLAILSICLPVGCVQLDDAIADDPVASTSQALNGDTWTTVDDNDYAQGNGAQNNAVTMSTTTSQVLVAGERYETNGARKWIVRGSSTGTSFTLNHTLTLGGASRATAATADGAGNFFVAGEALDASNVPHWIIRRSTNNGQSWTTVVDRAFPGFISAVPRSLTVDAEDRTTVWITGQLTSASGTSSEFTQTSANGTSFTDWSQTANMQMTGICTGADGVWEVGSTLGLSTQWVVRHHTTGASTRWDFTSYQQTGFATGATACGFGLQGTSSIFVGGEIGSSWDIANYTGSTPTFDLDKITATPPTTVRGFHIAIGRGMAIGEVSSSGTASTWRTRFLKTNDGPWTDSDDFTLSGTHHAGAYGIIGGPGFPPSGFASVYYVVGVAVDSTGRKHGIVRRMLPQ